MLHAAGLPALLPRRASLAAQPPRPLLCGSSPRCGPSTRPPPPSSLAPAQPGRRRLRCRAAAASSGLLAQLSDAADAASGAASDAASAVAAAALSPEAAAAAAAAADAAKKLADNKSGFLGGIANVLEGALAAIDGGLHAVGVPYSYGFSIIILTFLVKAATFPLSRSQIESTTAMQALAPKVKDLQASGRHRVVGGGGGGVEIGRAHV